MTKVRRTQGLSIGIMVGLRLHFSKHNPFSLRSLRTRRFNALPAATPISGIDRLSSGLWEVVKFPISDTLSERVQEKTKNFRDAVAHLPKQLI